MYSIRYHGGRGLACAGIEGDYLIICTESMSAEPIGEEDCQKAQKRAKRGIIHEHKDNAEA